MTKTLATHVAVVVASGLASTPASLAATAASPRSVVLVAHRGSVAQGYPENTLAAFRHAIANGVDAIEVDLRSTKDGEIVILHDATVDRTTNGRGRVADWTLAELRKLDAGGGERIPTYAEVLQLVSGTEVVLLVDIKESSGLDPRDVVRLAEGKDTVRNLIVGARNLEDLREFRALNPALRTLGFIRDVPDIGPFAQTGADIIRLWPQWIQGKPDLVDQVHQLGKLAWVTAGNASHAELEQLIRWGVDGILSDRPGVMSELREDLRKRRGP